MSMRKRVNILPKLWDVREHANTKLVQDNSLGLGMGLTCKNTWESYYCSLLRKGKKNIEEEGLISTFVRKI